MLLGLWLAKNLNQVRGVMVAGASCLLALSIWLTIYFIQERAAGNTAEMLLTYSVPWFKPLNIAYSVGVDGISVVMLLLSSIIVFTGGSPCFLQVCSASLSLPTFSRCSCSTRWL